MGFEELTRGVGSANSIQPVSRVSRSADRDTLETPMKSLLTVTSFLEFAIGVALALSPSLVATILLGTSLDAPAARTVGRVTGAALVAMGVACWLARHDERSRAATGLVVAMLLYNIATVAVLAAAGVGSGLHGLGLWPTVVLHAAMASWCVMCLRSGSVNANGNR